jgi:SAM-dependent methyltransferase
MTVDPLANFYNRLHREYATGYNIRCVYGYGEILAEMFGKERFHLACSRNAVDHSMSPELFVDNLYEILKPGGYMILEGAIREGSTQKWLGLHKWDIEAQDGDLLLTNRSHSICKKSLTRHLGMTLVSSETDGHTYRFIWNKKQPTLDTDRNQFSAR